mgnify:CR=1 FL=1
MSMAEAIEKLVRDGTQVVPVPVCAGDAELRYGLAIVGTLRLEIGVDDMVRPRASVVMDDGSTELDAKLNGEFSSVAFARRIYREIAGKRPRKPRKPRDPAATLVRSSRKARTVSIRTGEGGTNIVK